MIQMIIGTSVTVLTRIVATSSVIVESYKCVTYYDTFVVTNDVPRPMFKACGPNFNERRRV